jgi:fumarylacetoacetase
MTDPILDSAGDPARTSWVASANGHAEFPIQNLPLGVFSPPGGGPRGGVAIGDSIFDIGAGLELGLFSGTALTAAQDASGRSLNPLLGAGSAARQALRRAVSDLLAIGGAGQPHAVRILHDAATCTLHMPARVGNFTDFFAGIDHVITAGKITRPDNPVLPNYRYVPVAYHSRASSVRVSGEPLKRPNGQRKLPTEDAPTFGPCRNLDYEIELGIWVGPGNPVGEPIAIGQASSHIAGFCLLNDWSARDIQSWESQPLGPFLGKSFSSFVSPWIVTAEALAPFRAPQPPRPAGDPAPLPHLLDAGDQAHGGLDIDFEVYIHTAKMRADGTVPHRLSAVNASVLYWTVAQMVAHHTSNGCNLMPGDLLGTGTLSGPDVGTEGCLLEMSRGGHKEIDLTNGETRRYLVDGDDIIFRAHCQRPGRVSIGFGECRGRIGTAT